MSKKKRLSRKEDNHHLWYCKSAYGKGYLKALRTHWYCVVKILRKTLHSQIHHELMWVHPPSGRSAKYAYEHLMMLESYGALKKTDSIEQRLGLMIALFECSDPDTVEDLKAQLAIVERFKQSEGG